MDRMQEIAELEAELKFVSDALVELEAALAKLDACEIDYSANEGESR